MTNRGRSVGLARATRVTMADGTKRLISEVSAGDSVLSVVNGAVVPSTVSSASRAASPSLWWVIQGERRGAGRGNSFFKVQCVPEYRFWSSATSAHVSASELVPGDRVLLVRSDAGITPIQEQVLIGKMLGDGSLYATRWSAHVQWSHKAEDVAYMDWIERALGELANLRRQELRSGHGSIMSHGTTHASAWIKSMFHDWFNESGRKRVPPRVAAELSPLALAFWYMDDGSLSHSSEQEDRASIATCGFDDESQDVLVHGLSRLGVHAKKFAHGGVRRLALNSDAAERLFLLVAPYIPPAMQRKLPARYRGSHGWLPPAGARGYKPLLIEQVVSRSEPDADASSSAMYDLTTESGNYFASSVLVSAGESADARSCMGRKCSMEAA